MTLRFDENQVIDSTTLSAIRVSRGGNDGILGTADDVQIVPGFIGVGKSPEQNEVILRFAESLPDDVYRYSDPRRWDSQSSQKSTRRRFRSDSK